MGISWTPGPGTVAGRGVEVVVAGGLLVAVGFGVYLLRNLGFGKRRPITASLSFLSGGARATV